MNEQLPQQRVDDQDNHKEQNISIGRGILAILVGAIVDLGGTNVAALLLTIGPLFKKAFELASQGLSQTQIQTQLMGQAQSIKTSPIQLIFGILFSLLGGYIAGRIARSKEVLFGLSSALAVIAISACCTFALQLPTGTAPIWKIFLQVLLSLGVSTLGGYLAYLQRTKTNKQLAKVSSK